MGQDRETIGVYDAKAEEYQSLTKTDEPSQALQAFVDGLPDGARVLDLGCGPGQAAAYMASVGLQAEAWDASDAMVRLAASHPGVVSRKAVFSDLNTEQAYDAIWANFSLLHAPRADMPGILRAIARALKPGGRCHIALKEGAGEQRDRLGRFYTYYNRDELVGLLVDVGLTPGPVHSGEDTGLDGSIAPWISVTSYA